MNKLLRMLDPAILSYKLTDGSNVFEVKASALGRISVHCGERVVARRYTLRTEAIIRFSMEGRQYQLRAKTESILSGRGSLTLSRDNEVRDSCKVLPTLFDMARAAFHGGVVGLVVGTVLGVPLFGIRAYTDPDACRLASNPPAVVCQAPNQAINLLD